MVWVAGIKQDPLGLPPTALPAEVLDAGSSDLVIYSTDLTTLHRAWWSRAFQVPQQVSYSQTEYFAGASTESMLNLSRCRNNSCCFTVFVTAST